MAEPEDYMKYAYYQNSNLKKAVDNFNNLDLEDSIEILEWEDYYENPCIKKTQ